MNDSVPVIIRRVSRAKASRKSNGAWKVAFADFTLAMMAFFMVLWILEVSNVKERTEIANYMRTHSIFEGSPALLAQVLALRRREFREKRLVVRIAAIDEVELLIRPMQEFGFRKGR